MLIVLLHVLFGDIEENLVLFRDAHGNLGSVALITLYTIIQGMQEPVVEK